MADHRWPLKLGKKPDAILIGYLLKPEKFPYLRNRSLTQVKKLKESEDLRKQSDTLKKLWPLVLTDSLKVLKTHDTRECHSGLSETAKKRYVNTFFHEHSLGVTELTNILTGFTDFEGMLYGLSPDRYRDHVAHAFRVWILGHMLLDEGLSWDLDPGGPRDPKNSRDIGYPEDQERLKDPGDTVYKAIQRDEWQCMWAIASLCHDIGYPLSAIEKINKQARSTFRALGLVASSDLRFAFSQQMLPFHDTIIRLIASKPVPVSAKTTGQYLTHLQNKYYLKFLKSFDNLDHGILSALLMSKALVYFLESDLTHDEFSPLESEDTRQFLIRREILRSIAAHTCPDVYHLKFNTLSFMLYVVDELQCWGRPTMEEMSRPSADLGKATVTIREFSAERIDVQIQTPESEWSKEQRAGVRYQLDRLHRMLRLAVDTPKRSKRLYLSFDVRNASGQSDRFLLHKTKITKKTSAGSPSKSHGKT